ncbi:MAG: ribonuclease III [Flavobacteriales bacterium]|nr:ribonuclease III [Flavobacteriales bacterium]
MREHFGFEPEQIDYYEQALRHSSAAVKEDTGVKNSNERLEFLGDAILDAIVADYLYQNHPEKSEGDLTKMKAKIVSRRNLNAIGRDLDLPNKLELNLGGQEIHQSIIGNAFEALVGAIYMDKGYDFTEKVLIKLLTKHEIDRKIHVDVDFKSKLHEWCQKERKSLGFKVLNEIQENGRTEYVMEVLVGGEPMGRGEGKSKKAAEQVAAKEACKSIFPD